MDQDIVAPRRNSDDATSQQIATKSSGEMWLTRVAILACLGSLLFLYRHLASVALNDDSDTSLLLQVVCSAVLVTTLMYGTFVYLLTRLGYLRRAGCTQLSREELETVYDPDAKSSSVCILIPTYKEELCVLRQTIISAALSEYPARRVTVLIDDPARGSATELRSLAATRQLVADLDARFRAAAILFRAELSEFLVRQNSITGCDLICERHRLADLYERMAETIEKFAAADDANGAFVHTDQFFRDQILISPASLHRSRAAELRNGDVDIARIQREYCRLASLLSVEITSFERKRFANLSHAPNKAMNLNSYIGLIGKNFRVVAEPESHLVETCQTASADICIPHADFLLTLDADSLVLSDYILKLAHHMQQHPAAAVVQTPYSAVPGSINPLERAAGAQTDVQYITHQGFTDFGGTYWVGANALLRLDALRDVEQAITESGQQIRVFIQDRTVIEDTGSTIDLVRKGWLLHNYPERLAYSATPADFGSLIIQRRRWANGGLIIFSDLVRYATAGAPRPGAAELLMRAYYLCSPALTGFALIFLMLLPLNDALATIWLPCTAVPYFALYARDLRYNGYGWVDLPRVYALNLMLLPINLAGVLRSIEQILFGRKMAFGRTPKVEHRTKVSPIHVAWQIALPTFLGFEALASLKAGQYFLAICWGLNAALVLYGFLVFIGIRDAWSDLASALTRLVPSVRPNFRTAAWIGYLLGSPSSGAGPNTLDRAGVDNGRIASMEGLRAYAVSLVFLVHFLGHYFDRYSGVDLNAFRLADAKSVFDLIGYYFWASHYGVDLFFLLSGFLIYRMVSRSDFGYFSFLRDRLLRLYPAFLFALALQIAYAKLAWNQTFDISTIAANVLLMHGFSELGIKAILIPTWSLAFEWVFYIIFPLLALGLAKRGRLSLTHIIVLTVLATTIIYPLGGQYVRFVMFFAGAALASAPPRALWWISRIPDWPVIAMVVLVNMLFAFGQNFNIFVWPFALSSLLLVGMAIYGRGILNRLFCLTPLRRLGNLSYSFYLLHGTVVIATVDYFGPMLRGLPASAQFGLLIALSFAASIGCSQVSFLLFEKMYFDRKKRTGPVSNIGEQAERVGAFRARSATMAPETVTSLPREV